MRGRGLKIDASQDAGRAQGHRFLVATSVIPLLILCVASLVKSQLASQGLEVASVIEPSHIMLSTFRSDI
jgi:hypothetical protein